MRIKLSWQKRAIVMFVSAILILSIILTILAIREAEREKLLREREVLEEQQRCVTLLVDQVDALITDVEEKVGILLEGIQDQPDQANLKKAFVEFVMPPEMGGRFQSAEDRNHLYYQAFQGPVGMAIIQSPGYLEQTQLKGSSESFGKLWRQYLEELTEVDDPVVKFNSCVALMGRGHPRPGKGIPEAKRYCYKALEVLQKELKTPDEPFNDSTKQRIRGRMKSCLIMALIEENELASIWEEIYEPLIEKKDVDNLVLWDPGWRPKFYRTSIPDVARRYFQLLERIAVTLQTRKDDMQVRKTLNNVRDAQALIRKYFPQLEFAHKSTPLPVTILLKKEDWPGQRGFHGRC